MSDPSIYSAEQLEKMENFCFILCDKLFILADKYHNAKIEKKMVKS